MKRPVVLMTGASEGLGYALASQLLTQGASVVICARREELLRAAEKDLSALGEVVALCGDIGDERFRTAYVDRALGRFGHIDAVVNNASTLGPLPMPTVLDAKLSYVRHVYEVNTFGPVDLIQKAMPSLRQQNRSLVVGVSSDAAVGGYPGWGVYGASKAAADLLYRTLGAETTRTSVVVYAVDPGDMATSMHEAADPGATGLANPKDVAAAMFPLFAPLFPSSTEATFPFPTGSRMAVVGRRLEVR